jgi:hypothetical protein
MDTKGKASQFLSGPLLQRSPSPPRIILQVLLHGRSHQEILTLAQETTRQGSGHPSPPPSSPQVVGLAPADIGRGGDPSSLCRNSPPHKNPRRKVNHSEMLCRWKGSGVVRLAVERIWRAILSNSFNKVQNYCSCSFVGGVGCVWCGVEPGFGPAAEPLLFRRKWPKPFSPRSATLGRADVGPQRAAQLVRLRQGPPIFFELQPAWPTCRWWDRRSFLNTRP